MNLKSFFDYSYSSEIERQKLEKGELYIPMEVKSVVTQKQQLDEMFKINRSISKVRKRMR